MTRRERPDLSASTAAEIPAAIVRGDFSAREVADSAFARIDALDAEVHAFNQVTPELAYAAADKVDDLVAAGPDELPRLPACRWRSKTT